MRLFLRKSRVGWGRSVYTRSENALVDTVGGELERHPGVSKENIGLGFALSFSAHVRW